MSFSGNESVATKNRKEKQAEIERLHEKTFKAWINAQLRVRNIKIEGELKDELKDGLALINLMEVLSGEKCPEKYNTKITLDMHRIENTTIAINFITKHVGKLSVSSTDVQQGNMRIILGMIWRVILTFKVERRGEGDADDKELSAAQRNRQAKKKLLDWCVEKTKGHNGVDIKDFGESWYDGLGFCALIHAFDPSLIDYESLKAENAQANLELAFELAEKHLDIPRLLDPADICADDEMSRPDEQCFMTYLSEFPIAFLAGKEKADDRAAIEAEAKRKAQEEEERKRLEAERLRAEEERLRAEAEKKRLEEEKARLEADKAAAEEEAKRRKEELEAQSAALRQLEEERKRKDEEEEEKKKKREEKKKRRQQEADEAEERAKREAEEASRLAREEAEKEAKERQEELEKRQEEDDAKRQEELSKLEAQHEAERLRLEEECRRLKQQLEATKGKLIGKLKVTIKEGRGVHKKDNSGKADPYCVLFLERQKEKTRTIKKNQNPKWDADFEFYVSDPEAALEVTMFDWNRIFSDSFLGKVSIPIATLNDGEETTAWYKLEGKKAKDKVTGELCLTILYRKEV